MLRRKSMNFFKTHFNSEINFNNINHLNQLVFGKVNVFNCWNEPVNIEFGKEDLKIGEYAIKSLEAATKALKNGDIDVLVTAPINKHNIQSEEFKFPGHTDYLAQELEGESLMFMVTDSLKSWFINRSCSVKDIVRTSIGNLNYEKNKRCL